MYLWKFISLFVCVCTWTRITDTATVATRAPGVPTYRPDYKYIPELGDFYKFVNKPKNWFDAKIHCDSEGSKLAIIRTNREAELIKDFVNSNAESRRNNYIGLQDLVSEGEFQTVDAEPISMVYSNWENGEPNDAGGNEDCVVFQPNGKLNDGNCATKETFLCKKEARTIVQNKECENYDPAYKLVTINQVNQCYKFHKEPRTWDEAFVICNGEEAQLAIINSKEEAEIYKKEFEKYPAESLKGNIDKGVLLLGFHDKFTENEFVTIKGEPLSNTGYEEWDPYQPDNLNEEDCGCMFRSGLLNDVNCKSRALFVCEKNLDDAQDVALNQRQQI